jgi:thioredoxin reductase (NADPH)
MRAAAEKGEVAIRTPFEVKEIHGENSCVARVTLFNSETKDEEQMDVEAVIALLGFKPDLGPISNWGLDLNRNTIKVSQLMETNIPGVYAAGDVVRPATARPRSRSTTPCTTSTPRRA